MRVNILCDPPTPEPGAFAVVTEDKGGYRFLSRTPLGRTFPTADLVGFLSRACTEHRRLAKKGRRETGVVGGPIAVVEIRRLPQEERRASRAERLTTGREGFWSYPWFVEDMSQPGDFYERNRKRLKQEALRAADVMPWEGR